MSTVYYLDENKTLQTITVRDGVPKIRLPFKSIPYKAYTVVIHTYRNPTTTYCVGETKSLGNYKEDVLELLP